MEVENQTTPEDVAQKRMRFGIKWESAHLAGFTAGKLRKAGAKNIPAEVPDRAVIDANGAFTWKEPAE